MLAAGSVEGEEFTAQAVAQVQGLDDLQVLRMLGRELAGRHRLVRELGEAQVDGRSLSRYRFSHFLVQQHVYQGLGEGERRLLHRRVGEALEQLYAGHVMEIAAQLAHHFAGDAGREGRYAAQHAYHEAARYLSRALETTPGGEHKARYELLLARERVCDLACQRDALRYDLAEMGTLAEELGAEQQAAVAARRAGYAYEVCDFPAAVAAAQVAVQRAQAAGHAGLQAGGHRFWGWARFRQGAVSTAWSHYNQALALAQAGGLRALEADALSSLGDACSDLAEGQRYCAQGLRIAREDGDRTLEGYVLHRLSNISRQLGDLGASWTGFEQCLGLARAIGDPRLESYALACLGQGCYQLGDYPRARVYFEQARRICEEGEDHYLAALLLGYLADVARSEGEPGEAWTYAEGALRVSREVGAPEAERVSLCRLGSLYRDLSDHSPSRDCYRQAMRASRPYGQSYDMEPLAGLARSYLAQGDLGQAQAHVAEILAYLDAGGSLNADCKPFWTYLTCCQVLDAAGDPRAVEILAKAYAQLQEWAARIPDDALRRSFLENVAENQEIRRSWEAVQAGEDGLG